MVAAANLVELAALVGDTARATISRSTVRLASNCPLLALRLPTVLNKSDRSIQDIPVPARYRAVYFSSPVFDSILRIVAGEDVLSARWPSPKGIR
jgi:hypothetical protein